MNSVLFLCQMALPDYQWVIDLCDEDATVTVCSGSKDNSYVAVYSENSSHNVDYRFGSQCWVEKCSDYAALSNSLSQISLTNKQ